MFPPHSHAHNSLLHLHSRIRSRGRSFSRPSRRLLRRLKLPLAERSSRPLDGRTAVLLCLSLISTARRHYPRADARRESGSRLLLRWSAGGRRGGLLRLLIAGPEKIDRHFLANGSFSEDDAFVADLRNAKPFEGIAEF
jgi:hypothetical protein